MTRARYITAIPLNDLEGAIIEVRVEESGEVQKGRSHCHPQCHEDDKSTRSPSNEKSLAKYAVKGDGCLCSALGQGWRTPR